MNPTQDIKEFFKGILIDIISTKEENHFIIY